MTARTPEEARICEAGGSGQLLPLGGDWEIGLNPRAARSRRDVGHLGWFLALNDKLEYLYLYLYL